MMTYQTKIADIPMANVLLLGEIGAGKSSFINSIDSVLNNRISDVTVVAESASSVTEQVIMSLLCHISYIIIV